MFFQFFTKLMRIFGLACRWLLITGLLMLYILPFQVESANTSGTSSSNQGTNNQSVLGSVLPACASTSEGVNLFLECVKQATLAMLVVGIIFVFIRVAYQSAAGLLSGGASAADIKQIKDLLGSLIVGLFLVGMPTLIIQAIDPLGRVIALNFLQEFNLGPDARLIPIDKGLSVITCDDLLVCVSNCNQYEYKVNGKKNCVYECKQKVFTSESEERCSQECVNKIPPDGDINQFSKDCVHTDLGKPKLDQIQTGSSGNSNPGSGNSSGNSNNN